MDINPTDPPPLKVKLTHINEHSHLAGVVGLCISKKWPTGSVDERKGAWNFASLMGA